MRIGLLLKRYRQIGEVSMRDLAREIGISAATLCRFEHGEDVDGAVLVKVLVWAMGKV